MKSKTFCNVNLIPQIIMWSGYILNYLSVAKIKLLKTISNLICI